MADLTCMYCKLPIDWWETYYVGNKRLCLRCKLRFVW